MGHKGSRKKDRSEKNIHVHEPKAAGGPETYNYHATTTNSAKQRGIDKRS